jgi:hypothetical protein
MDFLPFFVVSFCGCQPLMNQVDVLLRGGDARLGVSSGKRVVGKRTLESGPYTPRAVCIAVEDATISMALTPPKPFSGLLCSWSRKASVTSGKSPDNVSLAPDGRQLALLSGKNA